MKIRWVPEAELDRIQAIEYIFLHNPKAAIELDQSIQSAVERVATFSHLGRRGKISGTRELIMKENYRLVYQVKKDTLWVLALIHNSRQWPPAVQ